MKTNFDVAIIGGGIIGTAIAYQLAKESIDVVLLEAGEIGRKASGAAAGMLGAHSECDDMEIFYPFARHSQQAYHRLQNEIQALTGLDFEMKTGGILKLAYTEAEKAALGTALSLPTVEWYDALQLAKSVPGLNKDVIGAAYIKDDVNVLPEAVTRGFSKAVQGLGGTIHEYTSVFDILKHGTGCTIKTSKGMFKARYVVVANGVWSGELFSRVGLDHMLYPIKGECLSVTSKTFSLKHTIFHNGSYIMPRKNGELVIGSRMIPNDWNEEPTLGAVESLIEKAKTMLPGVTDMKINSVWAGLRPQTFDQKPFIGKHPEYDEIFFACGHSRNGVLLAPATAEMIRDFILRKPGNTKWVEAFKIDRRNTVLA